MIASITHVNVGSACANQYLVMVANRPKPLHLQKRSLVKGRTSENAYKMLAKDFLLEASYRLNNSTSAIGLFSFPKLGLRNVVLPLPSARST